MWKRLAERLEGRIVVLEPLTREHEPGLRAAGSDVEVWRWMRTLAGASEAAFHSWIADALERAAACAEAPFAVLDAASGALLGSTRYMSLRPEDRGLEIGHTWLARRCWGTGANAEAKYLLLEHAFERLGCMRVEFKTDARNERARAALEALPARFEGVFRKHMLVRGGELRDSAWYSVIDDDWPEVRENLRRRLSSRR